MELTPENSKGAADLQTYWRKVLPHASKFVVKRIDAERVNRENGALFKYRQWIARDPDSGNCYSLGGTLPAARACIRLLGCYGAATFELGIRRLQR